ncbi:MAG: hypothetical protein ACREOC_02825 [Gemmatimonadales bacterium]
MARGLGVIALLLASGCYRYSSAGPVDSVAPSPGSRIAIRLTEQGAADLARHLGNQVTVVEGNVITAGPDGLEVSVVETEDARRVVSGWNGERVILARQYIAAVQERRFSPGATSLVGAIVVGSMAGAYALFGGTSEATGPIGGPSPGNQ